MEAIIMEGGKALIIEDNSSNCRFCVRYCPVEVIIQTCQIVFGGLSAIKEIQQPENGSGKGSFVVIKAQKV